tara:strand:- start:732 stop:1190 length:459 start_codon:yes stop_codon:yes gene_type:complete
MIIDPIADYITLYSSDATQTGGQLVWNLNPEYVFKNRGQYCLVSLVNASVRDTDLDQNVVVVYKDGQNAGSSSNNGSALGIISVSSGAAGYQHDYSGEPVKYLTRARPTQIELNLTQLDKTAITIDDAVFVLKFEYLNTEQAQAYTLATMYS